MEEHEGLNELLHAVNAVRLRGIDCVQQRKDDLKGTQPGLVGRVLNDGDAQILLFASSDCPGIFHFIEVVIRIAAKDQNPIVFEDILHAHNGRIAEGRGVDHKSKARVKGVNLKGGLVLFQISFAVRQHHSVRCAADVPPLGQFSVLGGFIFGQSVVIQPGYRLSDTLVIFPADILNRLTHQVADLEGHDLIGPILNDFVVDFRPNILLPVKNGLIALVIPVEVVNIRLVHEVSEQSLLENINDVVVVDLGHIGIDYPTTKQCPGSHSITSPQNAFLSPHIIA